MQSASVPFSQMAKRSAFLALAHLPGMPLLMCVVFPLVRFYCYSSQNCRRCSVTFLLVTPRTTLPSRFRSLLVTLFRTRRPASPRALSRCKTSMAPVKVVQTCRRRLLLKLLRSNRIAKACTFTDRHGMLRSNLSINNSEKVGDSVESRSRSVLRIFYHFVNLH